MRKALAIAILMMFPGCLDTTPEELKGIEILAPFELIEGDSGEFRAHGMKPSGANYLWDFGDNLGGSGEIVNHIYADEGQYTITLTVIDGVAVDTAYKCEIGSTKYDATIDVYSKLI